MSISPPIALDRTYRLVTRSDFDGLVCAALLNEIELVGDVLFVHPKDVQDGKVELTGNDITTNLPYRSEVASSYIFSLSTSGQTNSAASVAVLLLILSLVVLSVFNVTATRMARRRT